MQDRAVYVFTKGDSAGGKEMKQLLGGKGANLCEMARLGLRVPPGFTITTKVCQVCRACPLSAPYTSLASSALATHP